MSFIQGGNAIKVLSGNPLPSDRDEGSIASSTSSSSGDEDSENVSPFTAPGFSAELTRWDGLVRVLVVGAGGIGCEVLHLLPMCGLFTQVTILDLDTISLSNLNRQFLFSEADVGEYKSIVAARRINAQFNGENSKLDGGITAVVGRVEAQPLHFFDSFDCFFLAVDSIEARQYMNTVLGQLSRWGPALLTRGAAKEDDDDEPIWCILSALPMIDCGTEGVQGHCRVVHMELDPRVIIPTASSHPLRLRCWRPRTPCIECTLYLFGEKDRAEAVPLCTLQSLPRCPEHCVLYAKEYLWVEEQKRLCVEQARSSGEALPRMIPEFDVENPEHMAFVTAAAVERQREYKLFDPLITADFVRDTLRRVVPAVSTTTAFIASQAVVEGMKLLTGVAPQLDNYSYFNAAASRSAAGVHGVVERLEPPCLYHSALVGGGDTAEAFASTSAAKLCGVCAPLPLVILPSSSCPVGELVEVVKARLQRWFCSLSTTVEWTRWRLTLLLEKACVGEVDGVSAVFTTWPYETDKACYELQLVSIEEGPSSSVCSEHTLLEDLLLPLLCTGEGQTWWQYWREGRHPFFLLSHTGTILQRLAVQCARGGTGN